MGSGRTARWHEACPDAGQTPTVFTSAGCVAGHSPEGWQVTGDEMRWVRDYALGWVLLSLFVLFWIGQTVVGWQEFVTEQAAHGEPAAVFGDGGYVWNWARTTLENWQSEMLQLFAMVALTSVLVFRGSPESKDGDEEMKHALARIERRLDELASRRDPHGRGAAPLSVVRTRATGD
jgi:hypothetical protein